MRKYIALAGTLLVAALLFAAPSKADSVMDFSLTAPGLNITFSLPQTVTPSSTNGGFVYFNNVVGTLLSSSLMTYGTIDFGTSGMGGATNLWSFGSNGHVDPTTHTIYAGPELCLVAPGLFTFNSNGTITFNTGTWNVISSGYQGDPILKVTDPVVGTPEPASLALLGIGSLALVGLRRRKSA